VTIEGQKDVKMLPLKMEQEGLGQGMQVASKVWQRLGSRFSPRSSRKERSPPFVTLVSPRETCVDF
jgi:hypothetical protein